MKQHHQDEAINIQLNLADSQRNAGRDYVEVTVIQSAQAFLEIASEDKIDEHTLHNPRLFKRRFGVEIANPEVRAQVLAIRSQNRLTDNEMCGLRRVGHLVIRSDEARLSPCRFTTWYGKLQLLALSLYCAAYIFLIALGTAPEAKRMAGLLVFALTWFVGTWILHRLYIAPARTLKRIGM